MKKLYIFILMLFTLSAFAEGPVVDPDVTPTWTVTCTYPVERVDGTTLALNEITDVEWEVSKDGKLTWEPGGSNSLECKQVYDLTSVPDGQYYYTATTVAGAKKSMRAYDADPLEVSALVVKRIANPNHPSGISGEAGS